MWLLDGDPIPCVGDDTRVRWLIRDVSRAELEAYVNAACALGWEFAEAFTIQEPEAPLVPEVLRVWCHAELPKPRRKRVPKKVVPVEP
jgi:hypothetical protein